jgi:ketosteroid isomerase-like protein
MGVQRSEAAAKAVEDWCEGMSAGDASAAAAALAEDPDAFAIGTQRIGTDREAWLESIREMTAMGVTWRTEGLRAWEAGDGGFAAGEIAAVLPDGMRLPMRMSAFLVRDADAFRVFNIHFSWAVPDEVAMPQAEAWREQLAAPAG